MSSGLATSAFTWPVTAFMSPRDHPLLVFPESFTALSPALAEHLAGAGTLLVGLDTPSVDPFDSKHLAAHHALFRNGVANLEGLVLDDVPPGLYELIALPLRLAGLDASPVRAVLRELPAES